MDTGRARAVRIRVSGEVQGVGFRAHAAQEAVRIEVRGWVRNEPDGSVALQVEGDAGQVDEMVAWCRSGPPSARVGDVDVREVGAEDPGTFEVRY